MFLHKFRSYSNSDLALNTQPCIREDENRKSPKTDGDGREMTDRYKQVESMTELTSYREIENYMDR